MVIELAFFAEAYVSSAAESYQQEIMEPAGVVVHRLLDPWQRRAAELVICPDFISKGCIPQDRLGLNEPHCLSIDIVCLTILLCENQCVAVVSQCVQFVIEGLACVVLIA